MNSMEFGVGRRARRTTDPVAVSPRYSASIATVLPLSSPTSTRRCCTQVNTARCVSRRPTPKSFRSQRGHTACAGATIFSAPVGTLGRMTSKPWNMDPAIYKRLCGYDPEPPPRPAPVVKTPRLFVREWMCEGCGLTRRTRGRLRQLRHPRRFCSRACCDTYRQHHRTRRV